MGGTAVDYVVDPELAEVPAAIPKMDLSDLASAGAAEQLIVEHLPKYETWIPLSVRDIGISGEQNATEVPVRLYAHAEAAGPVPALLYLHGGAFIPGTAIGARMIDDRTDAIRRLLHA